LGNAPGRAKAHVGEPAETVWKCRGSGGGTFIKEGPRSMGVSWWLRSFLTRQNKLVFRADEMQVFLGGEVWQGRGRRKHRKNVVFSANQSSFKKEVALSSHV